MLLAASITVFFIMLAAVGGAGYWAYGRETALSAPGAPAAPRARVGSNAPEWATTLVEIGGRAPWNAAPGGADLRKRLVAAGVRWEGAEAAYSGAQVLAPALCAVLLCGGAYALSGEIGSAFSVAPLALYMGYTWPDRYLRRRAVARRTQINRSLPDFLDLLVIAIESGLSLDQAVVDTARDLRRAHPTLSEELFIFSRETQAGVTRAGALKNLGERTNEPEMRKLCQMLIQADRFGSSVGKVLRTQARYMRIRRRQTAEEKAHKTGVKLLFPIFFLIMPSVFLVTAGPALVMLLSNFSKMAGP